MMHHRNLGRGTIVTVFATVVAIATVGCNQTGVTSQGTLYNVNVGGQLTSFFSDDLATVHRTALAVVTNDFHYEVISEGVDAHEGIIEAKTAKGRDVRVETYKQSDTVTKIEVFVGGDSGAISQDLLSKIESQL